MVYDSKSSNRTALCCLGTQDSVWGIDEEGIQYSESLDRGTWSDRMKINGEVYSAPTERGKAEPGTKRFPEFGGPEVGEFDIAGNPCQGSSVY